MNFIPAETMLPGRVNRIYHISAKAWSRPLAASASPLAESSCIFLFCQPLLVGISKDLQGDLEGSLVVQMVKNPPAMQETQVWSLGREDPLEKGMTTHSSNLIWKIPCTEEPGGLQCTGLQSRTEQLTHTRWSGAVKFLTLGVQVILRQRAYF